MHQTLYFMCYYTPCMQHDFLGDGGVAYCWPVTKWLTAARLTARLSGSMTQRERGSHIQRNWEREREGEREWMKKYQRIRFLSVSISEALSDPLWPCICPICYFSPLHSRCLPSIPLIWPTSQSHSPTARVCVCKRDHSWVRCLPK